MDREKLKEILTYRNIDRQIKREIQNSENK